MGRLYFREGRGYYMDLRDLGGGQKACVPEGKRRATTDEDEATAIVAKRVEELRAGRTPPAERNPKLVDYSKHHLKRKRKRGPARDSTVARDEQSLRVWIDHLGRDARLGDVDNETLGGFVGARRAQGCATQTILNDLHALSNMFERARKEGIVPANPVRDMSDKPKAPKHRERTWLEPGEGARLLKAAAGLGHLPYLRPILAAFLLTGGRKMEVLGLEVRDVELGRDGDRGKVRFRDNGRRRLKHAHHARRVPLWPQLDRILRPWVAGLEDGAPAAPVFPSPYGGIFGDIRGALGRAVEKAEIDKHVTPHVFRHTYAATRMQTLDGGAPVSPYTVMRELGHRSLQQILDTYGHLQDTRHRSPVVEYVEAEVIEGDFPARAAG